MESRYRFGPRWPLATLLFVICASVLYYSFPQAQQHGFGPIESSKKSFNSPRQNVWAELTEDEASSVSDFLITHLPWLNLTTDPHDSHDNFINSIEVLRPNKTATLPYLHGDGDVVERWAKVSLAEDHKEGPRISYYMAGPLPITDKAEIRPLDYIFNTGSNWVRNPLYDFVAIQEFAMSMGENVSDITQELLGAKVNREDPDDPRGLLVIPRGSRIETGGLMLWLQFYAPGLGSNARTLLPQGIYAKIDASSPDVNDWSIGEYYYNGVLYSNEGEFRAAVKDADFERTPPNIDGSWTNTEDFESKPAGRELPPPVSVQPFGSRYKFDREQNFVSWFGFEFYFTTARATGISLFDIRFKGERVMYELGLQEAMAHYAGDDPMQGGLEFMDAFFGMGKNSFELLAGYDCPAYADFIDTEYHDVKGTTRHKNSICLFEFTSDHALSRHTAQYSITVSRNTYLVLRTVSTVGNYDYDISYLFYLDGTIEVKVRASGYIFAAFYTTNKMKNEDEYGHRIHDALSSSMHDHVINFKADLDIAGTANELVRMALEPTTISYPWDQPEVKKRNTMHLVEHAVQEEVGLDWPKNGAEFYIAYSADKKNAWGERKGYRITSGTGMGATPHLAILNSSTLGESARWAEHDVWVLRRKDTEPASADPLNYLEPKSPIIDFTKLANHESLVHGDDYDGDLVVYFNLGAHHVPHSGDIPNTLMHTSASSVMFVPHNFKDSDPSRESVQGVRLQLAGKKSGGFAGELSEHDDMKSRQVRRSASKKPKAHYFGKTYQKGMHIPLEMLEPDLTAYASESHDITDLGFNSSAAGTWFKHA